MARRGADEEEGKTGLTTENTEDTERAAKVTEGSGGFLTKEGTDQYGWQNLASLPLSVPIGEIRG